MYLMINKIVSIILLFWQYIILGHGIWQYHLLEMDPVFKVHSANLGASVGSPQLKIELPM